MNVLNEIFVFLINVFVPVIPALLISLLFNFLKKINYYKGIDIRMATISFLRSSMMAVMMMLVSRVIYVNFLTHIPQGKYNLISTLFVFFLLSSISKLFEGRKMILIAALVIVISNVMIFVQMGKDAVSQIYSIGFLAMIVVFLRIFYESVLKYLDVEIVRIDNLKKGDLLSKEFVELYNLNRGDIGEKLGEIFMDGLTKEQVYILRDYLKKNNIEYIERQRTFSFSIYLVIGYAFTYFTNFDNVTFLIRRVLNL
ncbi:MAG: hypothetical protein N2746_07070 [Deltaproteobacteria bacterium]|nr:hypothetical protein [Deltaproteobacteria bacterium]